jgi:hypothetical protein
MKSILISINPQHALNILNGSKTLELRKSVPKDFIGWVYMYITLGKKHEALIDFSTFAFVKYNSRFHFVNLKNSTPLLQFRPVLNGKVVARWWFDGYDVIEEHHLINQGETWFTIGNDGNTFYNKLCLNVTDVSKYLGMNNGYAWHISKLEIFDKPMWLSEFYTYNESFEQCGFAMTLAEEYMSEEERIFNRGSKPLTRPSQSWQYVWVKE